MLAPCTAYRHPGFWVGLLQVQVLGVVLFFPFCVELHVGGRPLPWSLCCAVRVRTGTERRAEQLVALLCRRREATRRCCSRLERDRCSQASGVPIPLRLLRQSATAVSSARFLIIFACCVVDDTLQIPVSCWFNPQTWLAQL